MLSTLALIVPFQAAAQVDSARAHAYFEEAAALCERDGGRLWGLSLCGPMVFADAAARTIATNAPAPDGPRPPALGFANAPLQWGGERWAAYVWSLLPATDAEARGRLLIHELFHRVQPQLGLMLIGEPNDHIDTLEGRYWLQLEWRALARALDSAGADRAEAVADALAFRAARRALFAGSAERERVDEIREGLAQYTGTVVVARAQQDAIAAALRQLEQYAQQETFVRTFGYPSGVAYGLLLDAWSPGWTRRLQPTDDLGALLMQASGIRTAQGAEARSARYDGQALRAAEESRETERRARIAELRQRFVDGPVVIVPRGRGAVYVTSGATTIPGEGIVYFQYRVTAPWGNLESNGILEHADGETLRLAMPFRVAGDTLQGDGWTIVLAAGWTVRPAQRTGDHAIVPDTARQRDGAQPAEVRAMSFNIRYGTANDGDNAWPNRRALVGRVITTFRPTVLGVQEALAFQLRELETMLPGYARIGVGRDDGQEAGEFTAILYDTVRLTLLAHGTFWFSESPAVPGSTAWGATLPRICTWARFRDTASGRTFFMFNNHWDHQAQQSRENSAALLLRRVAARVPADDPAIVMGDFNAGEDNAAFARLVSDSIASLRDTFRALHAGATQVGTFNGFGGTTDGAKFDAILVTPGWTIDAAGIDRTREAGRYPSDHFPVTAVLRLTARARRAPRRRRPDRPWHRRRRAVAALRARSRADIYYVAVDSHQP